MTKNKDLYTVTVSRKDLDVLIDHFSNAGLAELNSDEEGSIIFNIPKKSSLDIKPCDPYSKLKKEIRSMKKRLKGLTQERAKKALENKITNYEKVLKLIC
jgi:hypothetical protein